MRGAAGAEAGPGEGLEQPPWQLPHSQGGPPPLCAVAPRVIIRSLHALELSKLSDERSPGQLTAAPVNIHND